jgi:CRISPR-associated protein Cas1
MATLLLDRAQLEVRADGDALALYEAGARNGTVPLQLLERVVIQGSRTRLDSGVLIRLAEAGVATLLLSPRASRRVAVVLGPAHNDAGIRLAQAQRVADAPFCAAWGRELVRAKLRRQQHVLEAGLAQRPDARKALLDAQASLARIADSLAAEGLASDSLRGLEGAAARAYFQGLAAVMPPALGFTGRNRRPPRDPVNACLSLAYTLLHFDAVRAAHVTGLDPLLGFYHRPAFGRESLASDLIEPLRPRIDQWVWQLLRARTLREDHFTRDKGACLLGKAARERFYTEWERAAVPLRRWLRVRAGALAKTLRREGEALLGDEEDESC